MSSIVTLLTDFGYKDGYVAEMKGVLLSLNPGLTIVDITHAVDPYDIVHGAYILSTAAPRFPSETIHVAVVDPGVGSARKPLIVSHDLGTFIAPDNGLLTPILTIKGLRSVREISSADLTAQAVSRTFHGRDIFAPAAGHVSLGNEAEQFGPLVADPVLIEEWLPQESEKGVVGQIVHIDRFGNLVTNIGSGVSQQTIQSISVGRHVVSELSNTYKDVELGNILAVIGSQDTLEISINGGDAAKTVGVARGSKVSVVWRQS